MTEAEHAAGAAGRLRAVGQVLALVLVAALLALLAWKVVKGNDGGAAGELAKGESPDAPAFTLPRLDTGGELSLEELKGKAVVVNFWASWCIPCKDEAPLLQETYERYRNRGLVVLGVDAQDFRQDARGFMSRFDLTYPVVHDGKGSTLRRVGCDGVSRDVLRRPPGPPRRRAHQRRHRHRAQPRGIRAQRPAGARLRVGTSCCELSAWRL